MDKKALLEQFRAEVEASGTSVNHILKMCEFNEVSNDFSSETIHDYSVGCLNGAWWMYQRQQAKVDELQEEFAEDERFLKEQIKDKDLKISNLEYQQGMDKELIQTLQGRCSALQDKVNGLLKRVDDLERMFEIKWTDEQIAPQRHSGDRIVYGDCVLGKFSIWWRTWKAWDRPGLEINDEFIAEARDVEEAKQLAKEYLEKALKGEGQ